MTRRRLSEAHPRLNANHVRMHAYMHSDISNSLTYLCFTAPAPSLSLFATLDRAALHRLEQEEVRLCSSQWLPGRPLRDSEIADESPERIVMFDDLRECMFPVTDPVLKIQLVCLLLEFLGVPALASRLSVNDSCRMDFLLHRQNTPALFESLFGDCSGEVRRCFFCFFPFLMQSPTTVIR